MLRHRRKHNRAYGVVWDENTPTPVATRLGQGNSASVSAKLPDNLQVVQNAMKRCILQDNGTVNYYLCSTDSTLKADCSTASDLTGTDGQVMTEVPEFWSKYSYSGTEHTWMISKEQFNGASRSDAFYKNSAWVKNRYMSAYEGSMWDATDSQMVSDAEAITNMYAAGDKLCSITGQCPKVNETRAEFRVMADNRNPGAGWRQMDYDLTSAIQLLYLVEYADFNSQSTIGMGRTELIGGTWTADSYIGRTGKSNSDGNGTNSVGGNTNDAYITYRGIENFFGNIWKWMDGINIGGPEAGDDHKIYVCNNDTHFADDTWSEYTYIVTVVGGTNDYQKTLSQISRGFIPATVGGTSSTYICDYYYQDNGWRVALLGGAADGGARAGVFCLHVAGASSYASVGIGGRLCF